MGKRSFALERGGPKDLRIRWRRGFRDLEITLGGSTWKLDRPSLAIGATVQLPDGASLLVKAEKRRWWSVMLRDDLLVERDGVPLAGSDGDARVIARRAASVMLLFGVLRLLAGVFWLSMQAGGHPLFVVVGVNGALLIVLGVLAAVGRRLPIAIAAGCLAVELAVSLTAGQASRPVGLLVHVLVIAHLVQSWRRMRPRHDVRALAAVFD